MIPDYILKIPHTCLGITLGSNVCRSRFKKFEIEMFFMFDRSTLEYKKLSIKVE